MTNKAQLFLDDQRPAPIGWHCVRSYDEFKRYIEKRGVPDVISFDHDLGIEDQNNGDKPLSEYEEKTGLDCAEFLRQRGEYPKLAIVHSFNSAGAWRITRLLAPYCPVIIQPWAREHYPGYE